MKKLLLLLLIIIVVLTAVIGVNTLFFKSKQVPVMPQEGIAVEEDAVAQRLSRALQIKTISYQQPWEFDGEQYRQFHALLEELFPESHKTLSKETVSEFSLLYTWLGSDATLQPIILMAHMDVVPVDKGTESLWEHDAFSGDIADGHVWGRGALDDKSSLLGILEAVESLVRQGFQPKRTVYLAFGHDEEVGGVHGAKKIAALLQERGAKAWFSLDEGSGIVDGIIPGLETPIALISLAEKGYVSLEIAVEGAGGHSSNPPARTTISLLGEALAKLEKNQMPARVEGPMFNLFAYAGPEMALPYKAVMANLWLFKPVLARVLSQNPQTNAALRTTTAATIFNAGTKENVLPIRASAVVNFRILPGDTVEDIVGHVRDTVAAKDLPVLMGDEVKPPLEEGKKDNRNFIRIRTMGDNPDEHGAQNASPVSDFHAESYKTLERSIREIMPEVPVAPGMSLGGTDSKHFYTVSENCYRFQPLIFNEAYLGCIHGTNERVEISNYSRAIKIYAQIIQNTAG